MSIDCVKEFRTVHMDGRKRWPPWYRGILYKQQVRLLHYLHLL